MKNYIQELEYKLSSFQQENESFANEINNYRDEIARLKEIFSQQLYDMEQ
jgi:peptidoglycan hydrolase CwlO-like protein